MSSLSQEMKIFPYTDSNIDNGMLVIRDSVRKALRENSDDFLILVVGDRNTGKSHWMLHFYELADWGSPDKNLVAWDKEGLAKALKINQTIDKEKQMRFLGYDEANVMSRNAMTNWNRDLIDLYYSIRAMGICHVWCNPSAEILDKVFIKEILKGLVFVKDKTRVLRRYYYFTSSAVLKLFEEHDLSLKTINKYKKKYAYFRGWYKPYKGNLLKHYLLSKNERINKKIDKFNEKYGEADDGKVLRKDLPKILNCSRATVQNYENELRENGFLKEGVNFSKNFVGKYTYDVAVVEKMKEMMKQKYERSKVLKNWRARKDGVSNDI